MRWFRLETGAEHNHSSNGENRILIQNLKPKQSHYFYSAPSFQLLNLCQFSVEIFFSESHDINASCTLFISEDLNARTSLIVSQLLRSKLIDTIKSNDMNSFYCLMKDPKDLEDFSLQFLKGDLSQGTFVKNIDEFKVNEIDLLAPN